VILKPYSSHLWHTICIGLQISSIEDYTQAIEYFQKSLKINANNVNLLNNLAFAFLKLDKFEEAENTLKSALSLNPHDTESLELLKDLKILDIN
jgi:tetratricopeptide (TPR) repeat protein